MLKPGRFKKWAILVLALGIVSTIVFITNFHRKVQRERLCISVPSNTKTDRLQRSRTVKRFNFTTPTYSCSVSKLLRSGYDISLNKLSIRQTKIGILIASTTRTENVLIDNFILMTNCLPSLIKTMEEKFFYKIFIGIDKGDYLETVQDKIKTVYDHVEVFVVNSLSFTKTINEIACEAYKQGMDYFLRVNDDTKFTSANWTSLGIEVLQTYDPPNVGVVGPTFEEGNTEILTHDMTHRTHLEIYGFYFPPYFENWWVDDWITLVYTPFRSTKIKKWTVEHLLHCTRYIPDMEKMNYLRQIVLEDNEKLIKYIMLYKLHETRIKAQSSEHEITKLNQTKNNTKLQH